MYQNLYCRKTCTIRIDIVKNFLMMKMHACYYNKLQHYQNEDKTIQITQELSKIKRCLNQQTIQA